INSTLDCNKENDAPRPNVEEQSVLVPEASPELEINESFDVDLMVKKKLEQSTSATLKGNYGLDEISLTGSSKTAAFNSKVSENAGKTVTKTENLEDRWQTVGNPKKSSRKSKVTEDASVLKFRTQEKYINLVALILDVYKQLEREEAKEVLETVFTSTNQLAGLRQAQILAEVDLVVTEWYSDRIRKTSHIENGEDSKPGPSGETDNKSNSTTSSTTTGNRSQALGRRRSLSQGF
ncbi:hypothetical protein EGW08_004601, partial [Elysia chlorotica]